MYRAERVFQHVAALAVLLFLWTTVSCLASSPGTIDWVFNPGTDSPNWIRSSPALAEDGTIYVSTMLNLYALYPNGTVKWELQEDWGWMYYFSPAVGPDGTVYVGSSNRRLYAIDPDGTIAWTFYIDWWRPEVYPPAIGADGTIYFGSTNRNLYALNPDGSLLWRLYLSTTDHPRTVPSIAADGTLYVGTYRGEVFAVAPNGTLRWKLSDTGVHDTLDSFAIDSDGTVYVGAWRSASDIKLLALNPDGTLKWEAPLGARPIGSPVIGPDGTIYVQTQYHRTYAINPDGSLKWTVSTWVRWANSPVVGLDGAVYVAVGNRLLALSSGGTKMWECPLGGSELTSPVIANDGTIYVSTNKGGVYAIHSDSLGLADSPWPMFLRDGRHTARAGLRNQPPLADAGEDQIDECSGPQGALVTLDGTASTDPDGDPLAYGWSAPGITFDDPTIPTPTATFPLGTTTVTLLVDDGQEVDVDTVQITIEDTTAPVIQVATPPITLWPPNHKYVAVELSDFVVSVTDICDADVALGHVLITSASSDEPEDAAGSGDGDTLDDIDISTDCVSADLRAERQGNGNGRVYTMNVGVTDASDNAAEASFQVHVPRDKNGTATDDGPAYTLDGC